MSALLTGVRAVDPRVPDVVVLIDAETLHHGLPESSVCETAEAQPVPADTVRRLACEAAIIPSVLDGAGVQSPPAAELGGRGRGFWPDRRPERDLAAIAPSSEPDRLHQPRGQAAREDRTLSGWATWVRGGRGGGREGGGLGRGRRSAGPTAAGSRGTTR
jgi:hypothetical protein